MAISDAIENQKEWYYFRQVRFNLLDIENKGLKALILELEHKIKIIEEKAERVKGKLLHRIKKLTAQKKLTC